MSRTTRAFTIIELLVVIAVIGVLSAILLPAVSNVRRTAARTQDQSNQRQLVLGTINYADTRKGQIMSGNTQREVYLGGNSQYLRDKVCDAWVNANPSNPDLDGDGFGDTATVRFLRASDQAGLGAETPIDMSVFDGDYEKLEIPVPVEAIGESILIEINFLSDDSVDFYSGLSIDNVSLSAN